MNHFANGESSVKRCDLPLRGQQQLHYLLPETPLDALDALGDLRLEDEGLTYILSIVECSGLLEPVGRWVTASDANAPVLITMLSAAQSGSRYLPRNIRFSSPCGKVSRLAARQIAESVRKFVERLRDWTEPDNGFLMLWHLKGQPCVHLDHSLYMGPEQVAEVRYEIAKELIDNKFCPV